MSIFFIANYVKLWYNIKRYRYILCQLIPFLLISEMGFLYFLVLAYRILTSKKEFKEDFVMLWILLVVGGLGALVMAILASAELFSSYYKDRNYIAVRAKCMGIFIVIGLVGLFGLSRIDDLSYEEVAQTDDWELVSLMDNSEISESGSGGLFYVHVSIDTDEVYSFYYKVNNGGVKRGKVDAEYTTIYEKDDCTPHVVEYTIYTKNKMNKVLRAILAFGYGETSQKTYEIYTPTGTILVTSSLDKQ